MAWLQNSWGLILGLLAEHAWLSAVPILIGFAASLPLGWIAARLRVARGILLTVFNVIYTIPALALFVVLPPILGTKTIDSINVIVALTLYAMAMMLRGAVDAFGSVSADVLQAATAQGFSSTSRFWTVQLPLAGPVLLANLRVVSVSTVSLVSVAALIGRGGLGYLFTDGYSRQFLFEIGTGIVLTVLLALVFDAILVIAGRLLLPWNRRVTTPTHVPPIPALGVR
jgi:osmoprotectant transport system permease protein